MSLFREIVRTADEIDKFARLIPGLDGKKNQPCADTFFFKQVES